MFAMSQLKPIRERFLADFLAYSRQYLFDFETASDRPNGAYGQIKPNFCTGEPILRLWKTGD